MYARYARCLLPLASLFLAGCSDEAARAPEVESESESASESESESESEVESEVEVEPPIDLALIPPKGAVVAGIAAKTADLVGGPKAEGQLGDLVLANHRARFLIEGLRPAGGYRQFGGNLVDADLQPGGEDRLGELWFAWNLRVFKPSAVEVIADGRDGPAVVRATGRTAPYAWADAILGEALLADPVDLAVTYEYRLAPDTTTLALVITFFNDQADTAAVELPLVAINMGDGAPAFTPGPGLANIDGGTSWPWTGGVGPVRAYGFIAPSEAPPIEGTVTGETAWGLTDGEALPSNTDGRAWVAVTRDPDVLALTPVAPDGRWRAVIPLDGGGEVQVQAFAPARGASEAVTRDPTTPQGSPGADIALALPPLAEVIARVRDPAGNPIPAQVTFFRDGAPSPFAPESVRFDADWGGNRSAVLYHTETQAATHLLPGDYRAVASRGYSWEIAETRITVAPGTTQTLIFELAKAVDDAGWTAADLHLHAFWSPDSEVPYPARLRQAAANDVALPVFTEHTCMGDLSAPVAAAGVAAWVTPVPGQEVSTVAYGHFGAFPLVFAALEASGGAVFEHGWAGTGLFEAMRAQHAGDLIVQVNHPRHSTRIQAYFGAIGLDARAMTTERAERWTLDWDTLEVFNDGCGPSGGNAETLQDWFNLNDHGIKKALSSGSDSHSEAAGIGHPRSWIAVTRAAVEADHQAIVAPLRARQSFVSCGPFVRFAASDGTGLGGMTKATNGSVHFDVHVEAPSWMAVDRVRLLENGVPVQTIALASWPRPDGLRAAVRYDGTLTATPAADAWYVVEVLGSGGLWPLEPGEDPYALTNPIDVDQNGDGVWTPPAQARTRPQR